MQQNFTSAKRLCTLLFLSLFFLENISAQAPAIVWQNSVGGSGYDAGFATAATQDGGVVIGGGSTSPASGDITEGASGPADYLVFKLDASGNIVWQNNIGGIGEDFLIKIAAAPDGGFFLAGKSNSPISGDKTEAATNGGMDFWIVKIDADGNVVWDQTICGNNPDEAWGIDAAPDGGCFVTGISFSNTGCDKTGSYYFNGDYWVIKLNASGALVWEKNIGGSNEDNAQCVAATPDGGCLVGGYSSSPISGDKTLGSFGGNDYWVVKLSSTGAIEWQKVYGGSDSDFLYDICLTPDGGYVLQGHSRSPVSGNKTEGSLGNHDYWVIKISATGTIVWQNAIGSSGLDLGYQVVAIADGYILSGDSESNSGGDKTQNSRGGSDYWIVKINAAGTVVWDKTIGGPSSDSNYSMDASSGGLFLNSVSFSNIGGDKTENTHGSADFWAIKLPAVPLPIELLSFDAKMQGTEVQLAWITATEQNSDQFFVEHSTDSRTWNTLDALAAKGESTTEVHYQYTHTTPARGANYYRLKTTDRDGSYEYSKAVHINISLGDASFSVHPNPCKDVLYLDLQAEPEQAATVMVIDALNRVVETIALQTHEAQINIAHLPAGVYTLVCNTGEQYWRQQVVKQ